MKISIITVCYNSEKTLPYTLKSVLEQTYKNYEYLIGIFLFINAFTVIATIKKEKSIIAILKLFVIQIHHSFNQNRQEYIKHIICRNPKFSRNRRLSSYPLMHFCICFIN